MEPDDYKIHSVIDLLNKLFWVINFNISDLFKQQLPQYSYHTFSSP